MPIGSIKAKGAIEEVLKKIKFQCQLVQLKRNNREKIKTLNNVPMPIGSIKALWETMLKYFLSVVPMPIGSIKALKKGNTGIFDNEFQCQLVQLKLSFHRQSRFLQPVFQCQLVQLKPQLKYKWLSRQFSSNANWFN